MAGESRNPITMTVTHSVMSSWSIMVCGRAFASRIQHWTPRKAHYQHARIRAHPRKCTACHRATKLMRERIEHEGLRFLDVDHAKNAMNTISFSEN